MKHDLLLILKEEEEIKYFLKEEPLQVPERVLSCIERLRESGAVMLHRTEILCLLIDKGDYETAYWINEHSWHDYFKLLIGDIEILN